MVEVIHIPNLGKNLNTSIYEIIISEMAQGTGSHPCPWPKFITMFNYWRSLGNLIWPIAILHYSWGRVTNWGSLLLSRNKNFWYFLGAISGLKLGWTSKITFQLIGEALRIIWFFIIEWRIIVKHFNLIQTCQEE